MARSRICFDDVTDARIVALMRAGGTQESIAAQINAENVVQVSQATIGRRMAELAGRVKKGRAVVLAQGVPKPRGPSSTESPFQGSVVAGIGKDEEHPPLPESPDAIPPGTDLDTLNDWIETAKRMGKVAEVDGDLDALAKAGRLVKSLLEEKRRATPPMRPDPNDSPDMVELGKDVAARFRAIVEQVTR